jgi:hypothetical protein
MTTYPTTDEAHDSWGLSGQPERPVLLRAVYARHPAFPCGCTHPKTNIEFAYSNHMTAGSMRAAGCGLHGPAYREDMQ